MLRMRPDRPSSTSITHITRRDVLDYLRVCGIPWYGRLDEVAFLSRLWELDTLPSTDSRFATAADDIRQHRIANDDWDNDWIFSDSRFLLASGPDKRFLDFLSAMVHPAVRSDQGEIKTLVTEFNRILAPDGWTLAVTDHLSGRPIFTPQQLTGVKHPATALRLAEYTKLGDPKLFEDHMKRIEAGLKTDPAAAIGSSKEVVESVCKLVLDDRQVPYANGADLPELYRAVAAELNLKAESVPDNVRGSQAAQKALRALVTTVQCLAELRNELGLGHGRSKANAALTRHGRLAFNAALAVSEFLLDTWHERDT